ncbi:MAG: peptidylprolyl isomerase [Deltaproteobacteria bacterium]|nr:peptidylprolyl isomerase [Deltaproteobacteria bacterium]
MTEKQKSEAINQKQEIKSKIKFRLLPLASCLLSLFFLLTAGCKNKEEKKSLPSISEVVIRINNREITRREFQDIFKKLFIEDEAAADLKDEELKNLKIALVNQFVEEELLLQEAQGAALNVDANELSRELEEIKREYAGDAFEPTILSKYGSMEKWKDELKKKLLIKKIIDKAITSKLTVKESDAGKYYKEHMTDYKVQEQIRALMIVVKTEDEADQIRERLKKGENFAKLAEEVSLGPEGKKGGNLGFFSKGIMPKEFEDVVFSLPAGKLSQVIKTVYGYHIFRVEEKKGAKDLKFSEVKNQIINKLKKEKSDAEFQVWMKELKQKARIEVKEELL